MKTLEKILNSVKKVGKKAVAPILIPLMLTGSVKANPGYLSIENNLNSHSEYVNIVRNDSAFPGATDGYDEGYDHESRDPQSDYPDIYSDITTNTLWGDYRAEDSNAPYDIRLSFEGELPSTQPNWLVFDFYNGPDYNFGDKPIIFQARFPYGSVVDVRRAIDKNSGRVDLIEALAETSGEYGSGILDIGTRLLGDFDDNGQVDFYDFLELAEDWEQGPVQSFTDICGPNGVPDGYVDYHDLSAFCEDWLKSVE